MIKLIFKKKIEWKFQNVPKEIVINVPLLAKLWVQATKYEINVS